MKHVFIPLLAASLVIGCNKTSTPPAASTTNQSQSLITAPVDYLNAISKGQQKAVSTIDTVTLSQAIQLFYTEKGHYPKNLDELAAEKYIAQVPTPPYGTKIDYDASSGTVKVVPQ